MFSNLREEIRNLNSDVNNVSNSQKAKGLKRKLLTIGFILAIIGYAGVFTCFILFILNGFNNNFSGFGPAILVPFILIIPFGIIGFVGTTLIVLGFGIAITAYSSKLADDIVWDKCPTCGEKISKGELFCTKCGSEIKNTCPNCGTVNDKDALYCAKCGKRL